MRFELEFYESDKDFDIYALKEEGDPEILGVLALSQDQAREMNRLLEKD